MKKGEIQRHGWLCHNNDDSDELDWYGVVSACGFNLGYGFVQSEVFDVWSMCGFLYRKLHFSALHFTLYSQKF